MAQETDTSEHSNKDAVPSRRGFLRVAGSTLLTAGALGAVPATTQLAPPDKQPPNLPLRDPKPKAKWAIVGLGQLALEEVMPAFKVAEMSRPTALVSGHPDKARRVAAEAGVDPKHIYTYDNFDTIANDPEIDIVYIILPNAMHAEYTIRALKAGKHVLCEKPMAASTAECRAMIDASKGTGKKLMIAYRLRYEPFNQTMIDLSRRQSYGPIQIIEASNGQFTKAPNIRLSKQLAGGALMDVGIYCINATRYITGEEPAEVTATIFSDPNDPRFAEVDGNVVWTERFPSGILAHCSASFNSQTSRRYRVLAQKGWYELDPAFAYRGLELNISDKSGKLKLELEEVNQFAKEMDHFSDCVMNNREPWTPGEEGLADMRVIEAVYESARTGKTVAVKRV